MRSEGTRRGKGGELRFGVLLAVCFAFPLVAFVLLRPNAYHGWHHFYFLHGPFCLLATFALMGMRQLRARGLRKRWLGGVACALTAAGLGAAAVEMAQIHPNQHLYFNFLVDRKTPERLSTRYDMSFYFAAMPQGREYLLRQTPAGAINLKKKGNNKIHNLDKMTLPAADRRRFTHDPSRDPDFYLDLRLGHSLKDPFPPVLHRFKVYNNTMLTILTPDLSRVDPAVADEYRALHRAATAGEPAARAGGYEVYRQGQRLAWVKEACEPGALMLPFWLKFYPADADRKRGYFFRGLYTRGARFDGKCLGAARLPDFALTRVRLIQGGEEPWEIEVEFDECSNASLLSC